MCSDRNLNALNCVKGGNVLIAEDKTYHCSELDSGEIREHSPNIDFTGKNLLW